MLAYVEILRPVNGIMAAVAVILGALIAGASGNEIFLAAAVAFLVSGAGMVINDYYDYAIDYINRPERPLPSGRIKKSVALYYSAALFFTALVIASFINGTLLALAAFNSFLEVAYAARLKKTTLFGNVAVSWLVASTYIFGGLITGALTATIALAAVAFLANLAREVYKTVTDMEGDRAANAKTIALVAGPGLAKRLGDLFVVAASAGSIALYVYNLMGWYYLIVQIAAVAVYAWSIVRPAHEAERFAKVGMMIGLVAVAAEVAARMSLI